MRVITPLGPVEIDSEEIAAVVLQQGIHSNRVLADKVIVVGGTKNS